MAKDIPKMDQEIIKNVFPGQVVCRSQRSVNGTIRGYSFKSGNGIIISTLKGRDVLMSYLKRVRVEKSYELRMRNIGNHLVCIMEQ